MRRASTDFYFLGDRTYVHGPTILGSFMAMVDSMTGAGRPSAMIIVNSRLRKEVRENGTLMCWPSSEPKPSIDQQGLLAVATVGVNDSEYHLALTQDQVRPIADRIAYHEESYVLEARGDNNFGGAASIKNVSSKKDLVRAIVAANKSLHIQAERHKKSPALRWIFASMDGLSVPDLPAEVAAGAVSHTGTVRFEALSPRVVRQAVHTTSQGWLTLEGSVVQPFRIGFVGEPKQAPAQSR